MSTTETITKQGMEHKALLQQFIGRLDQVVSNLVGITDITTTEDPEVPREGHYGFFNICLGLQSDYHSLCQTINNQLSFLEDHLGIGGREAVSTAPSDAHRFREKLLSKSLGEAVTKELSKESF